MNERSLHIGLQHSEGRRLGLLAVVLGVTLGLILVRELGDMDMGARDVFAATMELWAVVAGYTILLWAILRYANKRGILLPTWLWGVTTVLESLIPTAALLETPRDGAARPAGATRKRSSSPAEPRRPSTAARTFRRSSSSPRSSSEAEEV